MDTGNLDRNASTTSTDRLARGPQRLDSRPFYGRLDSLRTLGALAVAGYHFSGAAVHGQVLLPNEPWTGKEIWQQACWLLGQVLLPAHAALMVFFVISGFVLRLSLEHGPQEALPCGCRFFLRRIFRFYPVVIWGVILTVIALKLQPSAVEQGGRLLRSSSLLANMFLLDVSLNPVLWALQVELLMAPIILLLYFVEKTLGSRTLVALAIFFTFLSFGGRIGIWRPLAINLFAFVLGMLVPTLGQRFTLKFSTRAATCSLIGAAVVLLSTRPCMGLFSRMSAALEAYAAFLLVSLVVYRHDIPLLKILDAKALRLLGLASGSFYVLHMATVPAGMAVASSLIPPTWSAAVPALVALLVLPAWLAVITPLALCSYYLIEAPGIAAGVRMEKSVQTFASLLSRGILAPFQFRLR
jgi:peptidoglycan/LPS O-acetylase OafA/YrhL